MPLPINQTPAPVRTPGTGVLCLGRRPGESVVVTLPDGRTLSVTVASVRGVKVGLAFDAPPDVRVDRREVWDQKQSNAAQPGSRPR